MSEIKIKDRLIGKGHPTYVIAEMSANHLGDKGYALEIIDAAAQCGADCIKIQTYTADTLTMDVHNEYFDIKEGTWKGENLYSLYSKAYTPWDWQQELKERAESKGLHFFSTPFDNSATDFLESIGMEFYKIASFELVDIPLIKYVASKGKPIIMSTGMASEEEIREAVEAVRSMGNSELALLRCASAYPAPAADMNLETMLDMEKKFNVPVGLSDHSLGSVGAVCAVALGASIIEKHFCLDRSRGGADAGFSMEPDEFKSMVSDIRIAEGVRGVVNYDATQSEKSNLPFRRSLFADADIKAGEVFTGSNIRSVRPSFGLPPKYYDEIIGKKAACDIKKGTPLNWSQIQ